MNNYHVPDSREKKITMYPLIEELLRPFLTNNLFLPPSTKECNSHLSRSQIISSLTKFIQQIMNIYIFK